MLQLLQVEMRANPPHCPPKQAFDGTCFCPAGMGWKKWLCQ